MSLSDCATNAVSGGENVAPLSRDVVYETCRGSRTRSAHATSSLPPGERMICGNADFVAGSASIFFFAVHVPVCELYWRNQMSSPLALALPAQSDQTAYTFPTTSAASPT